jgi:HK97 family phage major capsid protein
MLDSVKIARRQSEIRQQLSTLAGKSTPTEEETRSMEALDTEYRTNETRYRAALIAEDGERREAGAALETRAGAEWDALVSGFELRQVALHIDEGRALDGRTLEVVTELRSRGGYRGTPVPWAALERRNTVASGTPDPKTTRPIIDRLFPDSVAAKMGAQMIAIESGLTEWPVTTSAITAGWQATETGSVAGPTQFTTTDKALAPNNTLGIRMAISRKAMLQSGQALEDAVRRDMNGAIQQALDAAIFRGAGASGEPLGVLTTPATYGITATAIGAAATWAIFRAAVARFMAANAANGPGAVKVLLRPEVWNYMDGALITSTAVSEWDRMVAQVGAENIVLSTNALAAPTGSPLASTALLTTVAGGIAPIFVGMWGAVDLIRDPYSDAASGGLRLTALTTADVTVARGAQLEILTGVRQA